MFTNTQKRILVLSVASLCILALIIGLRFVPSAQASVLALSTDNRLTIAYPGHLVGDDGKAVADGSYDFKFSLYEEASAGNMIWSEMQTGVTVRNGSFAVLLGSVNPLPETVYTTKFWLSVSVRGPQAEIFVELTPRQLLDEIAYTVPNSPSTVTSTCAHDHMFENWVGSKNDFGFRLENTGSGDGIRGVTASTKLAFAGVYASNIATTGQGAGLYGRSASSTGYGVYGSNSAGTAVYGVSSSGEGVSGASSTNNGVVGSTAATDMNTNMSGVYGQANNSFGVTGQSTNAFGMQASGYDFTGDDTLGDLWLDGDRGEILTGERLNLVSNWNVNIELDFDNSGPTGTFRIYGNNLNTEVFSVDEAGNMVATGTKSAEVLTQNNGQRLLYAVESPEVWFEDIGSAALVDGKVEVSIEPIFAQTVNLEDYQVFLTPFSEVPVVLYVVQKSPTLFIVQGVTLDGEPANCDFDYRIVAKRLGYEGVRLEQPALPEGDMK